MNISRILAFKLDGGAQLPPKPELPVTADKPPMFGGQEQIAAGGSLYGKSCAICHGVAAVSGGVLPDLRQSAMIASAEGFYSVVIDGALEAKGMAGWGAELSAADAEAIRAFIAFMANQ